MGDSINTTAAIAIVGFAIQRALQVVDPGVDLLIERKKDAIAKRGLADVDVKRAIMAFIAIGFGFGATLLVGLRFMENAGVIDHNVGDIIITALVLSAGAEGANSITKTLESVKASRQAAVASVEIVLAFSTLTLKVGSPAHLQAAVRNSANTQVTWSAVDPALTVSSTGDVTTPNVAGVYRALATSVADPTKTAVVTITVS